MEAIEWLEIAGDAVGPPRGRRRRWSTPSSRHGVPRGRRRDRSRHRPPPARAVVADFAGLRDLTAEQSRLAAMERDPEVTPSGGPRSRRPSTPRRARSTRPWRSRPGCAIATRGQRPWRGWTRCSAAGRAPPRRPSRRPSASRRDACSGRWRPGRRRGPATTSTRAWCSAIAGARDRDAASCRRPRTCGEIAPRSATACRRCIGPQPHQRRSRIAPCDRANCRSSTPRPHELHDSAPRCGRPVRSLPL